MSTITFLRQAHRLPLLLALIAGPLMSSARADIAPVSASQCAEMKARHTITAANPVPCSRLASVSFDYSDFDGVTRKGSVVVLDAVAPQVESLFGELLLRSVPLAGASPMEQFDGDDEKSMAANNTSAFNGRPITGGGGWSKHAYGAAIDVNPLQNPYVSRAGNAGQSVLPPAATPSLQRAPARPGMAEDIVGVLYDHGFLIWGGNWKQPIDYQHFEIGSRDFIRKLATLPKAQARAEFERYVANYRQCAHKLPTSATTSPAGDDDTPEDTTLRDSCAARWRR